MVVHKRQIFRCAPEQVRKATSEEECLADSPHLLETNALTSRQYVVASDELPPRAQVGDPRGPVRAEASSDPVGTSAQASGAQASEGCIQPDRSAPRGAAPQEDAGGVEQRLLSGSSERSSQGRSVNAGSQPYAATTHRASEPSQPENYGPVSRVHG